MFLPSKYTLVSGVGYSDFKLVAFDNALRDAGIGDYNLVKVSSIIPPRCELQPNITAPKGSIIFVAYASVVVDSPFVGQTAVAVAIPKNDDENGVIFEYSSVAGECAEKMVHNMCYEGMKNRNKAILEIKSSVANVSKQYSKKHAAAVSAVVMW